MQLDLPLEPDYQWQPLIDTSGDGEAFKARYGRATEQSVISFLVYDEENPNSIYSCLRSARENARSVRETISSEMWEQVNGMYLRMYGVRAKRIAGAQQEPFPEVLRAVRLGCHMFQGITDSTMSHNEAWHFLRVGRKLERADKTSRLLDVKYFILLPRVSSVGTPYDDLHWSAVLKSVSGFEIYRKQHGRVAHRNIVDLLVLDPDFPRSIRYCICQARDSLRALTGSPEGHTRYGSERLMDAIDSELRHATVDYIVDHTGLHEYLDGLQTQMNGIDDGLLRDFFAWQTADHAVGTGAAS